MFDTLNLASPLGKGASVPAMGSGERSEPGDLSPVLFLEMMTRQVDLLRQAYGENRLFEEVQTFHFNIRIVKATRICP